MAATWRTLLSLSPRRVTSALVTAAPALGSSGVIWPSKLAAALRILRSLSPRCIGDGLARLGILRDLAERRFGGLADLAGAVAEACDECIGDGLACLGIVQRDSSKRFNRPGQSERRRGNAFRRV